MVTVHNELNAFRMFETLNDRGMKVSQADLIKNFLFAHSGKEKITNAQELWATVRGTLESIDDDESMMKLIRYHLMTTNEFVEKKNIYRDMQKLVSGPNSAISMLTSLDKTAKIFVAISNASNNYWSSYSDNHKKNLEAISLFDLVAIRPLLIAAASIDKKTCEEIYSFALSATVRLLLASKSRTTSASIERPLSDCAVKIFNKEIVTTKQVKEHLASVIPSDTEFRSEFSTATSSQPKLARYYLRSMENAYKDIANPSHVVMDDAKQVTLEHILPKSPKDKWPSFDVDDHSAYLKRIGLSLIHI